MTFVDDFACKVVLSEEIHRKYNKSIVLIYCNGRGDAQCLFEDHYEAWRSRDHQSFDAEQAAVHTVASTGVWATQCQLSG